MLLLLLLLIITIVFKTLSALTSRNSEVDLTSDKALSIISMSLLTDPAICKAKWKSMLLLFHINYILDITIIIHYVIILILLLLFRLFVQLRKINQPVTNLIPIRSTAWSGTRSRPS